MSCHKYDDDSLTLSLRCYPTIIGNYRQRVTFLAIILGVTVGSVLSGKPLSLQYYRATVVPKAALKIRGST